MTKIEYFENLRICSRCVMDETDTNITFDENNFCNHCNNYYEAEKKRIIQDTKLKEKEFFKIIDEIKKSEKKYNCLIGISGGIDSSYLCMIAKKFDLKPILIHIDNGWNSNTSIKNIEKIIKKTNFDYYNYVINWEEYKDIQLAYLKSSVVDIEIPNDLAIFSIIPKMAVKYDVDYIINGYNFFSESIMGSNWNFNKKRDVSNFLDIYKKFGNNKLNTFPIYNSIDNFYFKLKKIQTINLFDYLNFNPEKIKKELKEYFNFEHYENKHDESLFTSFYQNQILPKKFNIDKRKAHLSNLIVSGNIDRHQALIILKDKKHLDSNKNKLETDFVINKLNLTHLKFNEIMQSKPVSHYKFKIGNEIYSNKFMDIKVAILHFYYLRILKIHTLPYKLFNKLKKIFI